MKRDMELVRQLLLFIEQNQEFDSVDSQEIQIDGYSEGQIGYHLKIMVDGGLLDAQDTTTYDSVSYDFFIRSITWYGHEFLDAVRDEGVWDHTKKALLPIGSASFDVVKSIAVAYIGSKLGL